MKFFYYISGCLIGILISIAAIAMAQEIIITEDPFQEVLPITDRASSIAATSSQALISARVLVANEDQSEILNKKLDVIIQLLNDIKKKR